MRSTFNLPYFLSSDSTTTQGAQGVLVDDIMRSTYSLYVSHFSLLRQSSSVIFHCLYGLSLRASNLAICSSELISIQNLITIPPESTICLSNPLISSAER